MTCFGQWRQTKPFLVRKEAMRKYRFPRTVISSESEKSFSFAVMKEIGGHRKTGNTVLHTLLAHGVSFAKGKASGKRKKRPRLCLGRGYEKMLLLHSFLFRCVSQPPPLRGTSFHRKEGESCPRIASPYRHFERKREIFFVCGQEEMREHRKTGSTVLHTLLAHGVSFAKETASGQRKALLAASMRRGFF